MAYRVVLVDDEQIILQGLLKVFPWEDFGCEVAGTAMDGIQGLKLVRSLRPDIILTDIRMPNMDGLGMIAALQSEFPDTLVAVLTAFRDFDYAQKALHLGVCRYLLKPSKMEELKEAFLHMTDILRTRVPYDPVPEHPAREYPLPGHSASGYSIPGHPASGYSASGHPIPDHPAPGHSAQDHPVQSHPVPDHRVSAAQKPVNTSQSEAGNFIVRAALQYIKEHYTEHISLSKVADSVYVSQWHLSKLINGHLGQSFFDIVNGLRIDRAKELLLDPALKVHEVALAIGYGDVAHFSKNFKKITGKSPLEYRSGM